MARISISRGKEKEKKRKTYSKEMPNQSRVRLESRPPNVSGGKSVALLSLREEKGSWKFRVKTSTALGPSPGGPQGNRPKLRVRFIDSQYRPECTDPSLFTDQTEWGCVSVGACRAMLSSHGADSGAVRSAGRVSRCLA